MADKERQGSRSPGNHFSPKRERSISRSRSRSRSRSYSPYRRTSSKRSKSPDRRRRSYSRSRSRSHSRSPDRRRRRSYSRSRSPYNGRRRSYSRSPSPYRRRRSPYHRKSSRSRSPMSDRRRHQGNRFNPDVNRCIGVFGLSLYTGEKELREILEEYGRVEEIQVVYDHQTGRSRGFAFAYYEDLNDAIEAKERCNGMELDGRRIRVDYSITKRAHTPTPGVYMGRPTRSDRDRGDRDRDRGDRDRGDRDRYDDDRGYSRYGGGGGGGRYY